jgi:sigma-54 dependent transcriptional regulator, acetoin dehydrogenase operon transcriptional activator AcoR
LQGEKGSAHYQINSRRFGENKGRIGQMIAIRQIAAPPRPDGPLPRSAARHSFSDLIGKSPLFLENIEVGMRAAGTSANVLITGESGTGKELFAQAIHNQSLRAKAPFVAINCAAIPRDLLASEIFGYMEGAFTGARRGGNPGKFELADHGTIFLDEIGDMPLDMQVSLLRVIEEKRVMRLGGRETIPVDARIIAATNKNLFQDVALGRFRVDLYYRLNVISIELPALRERQEDIPLLVAHLTRKIAGAMGREIPQIDPEFMEMCRQYPWPGNIRELMNLIEKVLSFSNKPVLSLRDLPPSYRSRYLDFFRVPAAAEWEENPLKEASLNVEKKVIDAALSRNHGNKSLAAKELGIARSSLYRKMGGNSRKK